MKTIWRTSSILAFFAFVQCGPSENAKDHIDLCTNNLECFPLVCDPATSVCSNTVPCSDHTDCGMGAFCNQNNNVCEPGATGSPCESDLQCLSPETCENEICGCEQIEFQAQSIASTAMILLDRSSSMNGQDKWQQAITAVRTIANSYGTKLWLGLIAFPADASQCAMDRIDVPPGSGSYRDIVDGIDELRPNGQGTPVYGALRYVNQKSSAIFDANRNNALIFITDGSNSSSCGGSSVNEAVVEVTEELLTGSYNVRTHAIGFSSGANLSLLDKIAKSGATNTHLFADDLASLTQVLSSVIGQTLAYTFEISGDLSDGRLIVLADTQEIDEDPVNGFTFDPETNRVELNGQTCEAVRSGGVNSIRFVSGCPIDIN